jgi:hypothetical protein
VNPGFHGVRQRTDRHDQRKLTGNSLLVVLMWLACIPRSRSTGRSNAEEPQSTPGPAGPAPKLAAGR